MTSHGRSHDNRPQTVATQVKMPDAVKPTEKVHGCLIDQHALVDQAKLHEIWKRGKYLWWRLKGDDMSHHIQRSQVRESPQEQVQLINVGDDTAQQQTADAVVKGFRQPLRERRQFNRRNENRLRDPACNRAAPVVYKRHTQLTPDLQGFRTQWLAGA